MKHYAYHNMSRRTQLTTKFIFQVMAQLSENFIFIYLGLSLFTEKTLEFKPIFILITVVGICVARWCSVFPLSSLINWFIRYRARRRSGREPIEEIPWSHQAMLFWAGLRGAVGVALAAGFSGANSSVLRATVLVVVVLTVIIFGGTTARMLEILGIKTGVVEELDSDDEFDIEVVNPGTYSRKNGAAIGHTPRPQPNGFALSNMDNNQVRNGTYSSGQQSPALRPNGGAPTRRNSSKTRRPDGADQGLLSPGDSGSNDEDDGDLDLPPSVRRGQHRGASPSLRPPEPAPPNPPYTSSGTGTNSGAAEPSNRVASATGAIRQLISDLSEDPAGAFRQIDEGFIKPNLLLDPNHGKGPGAV
jgi:solute carrier family 9 (sodium/hydrogen exchanger), member 6/7